MARIEDGAIIGKLGNLVGCRYKGRYYVKQCPVRTAPLTEAEKKNHHIFGLVGAWLRPLLPFVRVGFKGYSDRFEGFNAAKSMLFRRGLYRDGYDSSIDPSEVLLSYGSLGSAENFQAVLNTEHEVEFTWYPGVDSNRSPRDRVMMAAYNVKAETAVYETSGPIRYQGSGRISLAGYPSGTYHLYAAFSAENGKRQSNSEYLGMVEYPGG